jgi:hypothetical protein
LVIAPLLSVFARALRRFARGLRHCERSEAIQRYGRAAGLLRFARKDG